MVCKLEGVAVSGIAASVPGKVIDNREYGEALYGPDLEATLKIIGVRERRFIPDGVPITALDLCLKAAYALRDDAVIDYSSFGGLVFVTMTPDFSMPNNASFAHRCLGLPQDTPAFDISLACSGYPYGLWIAGMMAKSSGRSVLLLDGDTHSPFISPFDRSTSLLFGDGGTATVVAPSAQAEPWFFDFMTVGDRESLVVPDSGYRNRVSEKSLIYDEYPDGSKRRRIDLKMDGMAVFNAVVRNAPPSMARIMAAEEKTSDDYDYLLLHQANLMMINQVAKKMNFSGNPFPTSIHKYGNIGSGSIALNACSELGSIVRNKKSSVLMSAFGAGFSVGSASISLGPCACPEVVEFTE